MRKLKTILATLLLLLPQMIVAQVDADDVSTLFMVADTAVTDTLTASVRLHTTFDAKKDKNKINLVAASAVMVNKTISGQQLIDALTNAKARAQIEDFCIAKAMQHDFSGVAFTDSGKIFVRFVGNDSTVYPVTHFMTPATRMPSKKMKQYIPAKLYGRNLYLQQQKTSGDIKWIVKQAKLNASADSITRLRIDEIKSAARITDNKLEVKALDLDSLAEYAIECYARRTDFAVRSMTDFSLAIFDTRTKKSGDVVPYFRRYFDDCEKVHPSVLGNKIKPRYFVVVADDSASVTKGLLQVAKNIPKTGLPATSIVLLSQVRNQLDWQCADTICDAVYTLPLPIGNGVDLLSQALFGGLSVAKSDVAIDSLAHLKPIISPKTRLAYSKPYMASMSAKGLAKIDKVMEKMISEQASPGGYVLVARYGRVVYSKPYGNTKYKDGVKVTDNTLYDLASVSKMIGTLPIVMQMVDSALVTPQTTMGEVLKFDKKSRNKRNVTVESLLLHNSGLVASVPAVLLSIDSSFVTRPVYSTRLKEGYPVQIEPRLYVSDELQLKAEAFVDKPDKTHKHQISPNLYCDDESRDRIFNYMDESAIRSSAYRYSDLNFIYLQRIIEKKYGQSLDAVFYKQIANPLGLRRLLYRPLTRYQEVQIAPTENDLYFRHTLLQGTVHDQTAAVLGGVAGNAGLFGTANEVARIAQMFLNGGTYGGVRFVDEQTMAQFTTRKTDDNRRGYGFDKPEFRDDKSSPVTQLASLSSYGHTGFAGILVWVDPDYDLVYVFLSNRIHPNVYNNKLTKLNIRSKVHKLIYQAMTDVVFDDSLE
ncbi:MAG: serine hydrolase [Bacteroidales bacterium]|nr:serine hydrolase [Bacteroidales bacterium]